MDRRKDRKKTDMQSIIKCSAMCTVKQQYWFQNTLCHWKSPFHPRHSLYLPSIPCRPLYISSVPLVCSSHPLYMSPVLPSLSLSPPVHPLSPQVFSCHPLYMSLSPQSPPSSSTRSLAARWSAVLSIHTHFSCHKSWNLNHPSVLTCMGDIDELLNVYYLSGITIHW